MLLVVKYLFMVVFAKALIEYVHTWKSTDHHPAKIINVAELELLCEIAYAVTGTPAS